MHPSLHMMVTPYTTLTRLLISHFVDPPLMPLRTFVDEPPPTSSSLFVPPIHNNSDGFTTINNIQTFPHLPFDDPAFLSPSGGVDPAMAQRLTQQQRPQSFARKYAPIIHGIATLSLFAYLAFVYEPRLYNSYEHIGVHDFWSRWSQLSVRRGSAYGQSETVNYVVSN